MVGFKSILTTALGASTLLNVAVAHPGEHLDSLQIKRQVAKTHVIARDGASKLARCANSPQARAVRERAMARRQAKVEALRMKMKKRDSSDIQAYDDVSHNYTGSVSTDSDPFSSNTSCILEPQMTIGPYWVSGELIRQNDREDQEGVDMQLELQFIDTSTCEPVSGLYIDKWHANSTGVYAGIKESSLNSTYLRAIQITDDDGLVTFDTLVPGHYEGRATHTHVMVHQDVTAYDNGTYSGGTVRSIGQLFYETALRDAVEAVEPYSGNTNSVTTNEEDSLLTATTLGSYDPFVNYIYLGDSVSDGIFAWHSIGIDVSANYTDDESAAAAYYATGGVDESGSSSFGGGAGGPGNGTGMSGNGTGGPPSGSGAPGGSGVVAVVASTASLSSSSTITSVSTATANSGAASKGSFIKSILSRKPSASGVPSDAASHAHGDGPHSGNVDGPVPTGLPSGGPHSGSVDGSMPTGLPSDASRASGLPSNIPQSGDVKSSATVEAKIVQSGDAQAAGASSCA